MIDLGYSFLYLNYSNKATSFFWGGMSQSYRFHKINESQQENGDNMMEMVIFRKIIEQNK